MAVKTAKGFIQKKKVGFFKIWKAGNEEIPYIKSWWTDTCLLVFNSNDFLNYPPGHYKLEGKEIIPIPEELAPKIKTIMPEEAGYQVAKLDWKNDKQSQLNVITDLDDKRKYVKLTQGGEDVHIAFDYFEYLWNGSGGKEPVFKIKGKKAPILYYEEGGLQALVMPISL